MVSLPLFLLAVGWLLYKLFSEKPCPPGHTYDFEKADEDHCNGIGYDEWERRYKKGYYWTSQKEIEERKKAKEVIPGVVDIKRYENDKRIFGEKYAEMNRKLGNYTTIKEFT